MKLGATPTAKAIGSTIPQMVTVGTSCTTAPLNKCVLILTKELTINYERQDFNNSRLRLDGCNYWNYTLRLYNMSQISNKLTVKSIGINYMHFYERWMDSTWIDNNGLCNSLPEKNLVHLFRPDNVGKYEYWAYDGDSTNIFERAQRFTPLRQNIVLFLAAMNNEL